MSISRWDPWGEMVSLRDAVDRLVSESFIRPFGGGGEGARSGSPASLAVDVHEQGDNFVISAPVPGVEPGDIDISVLGDTLRIRGERRDERQQGGEGQRWIVREQRFGEFERIIRLPSTVRADNAQAEFKNGVLTVTLPKAEEAKERKIPIRGGQQSGRATEIPVEAQSGQGSGSGGANRGENKGRGAGEQASRS